MLSKLNNVTISIERFSHSLVLAGNRSAISIKVHVRISFEPGFILMWRAVSTLHLWQRRVIGAHRDMAKVAGGAHRDMKRTPSGVVFAATWRRRQVVGALSVAMTWRRRQAVSALSIAAMCQRWWVMDHRDVAKRTGGGYEGSSSSGGPRDRGSCSLGGSADCANGRQSGASVD